MKEELFVGFRVCNKFISAPGPSLNWESGLVADGDQIIDLPRPRFIQRDINESKDRPNSSS